MSFVSKYARLAPIVTTQVPLAPSIVSTDEINNDRDHSLAVDITGDDRTHDTFDDFQACHENSVTINDDLLPISNTMHSEYVGLADDDDFSYVPLKEEMKPFQDIPLLELDELETSSDISESQLVPIIYAKDLANEIELLQKAHQLKQQQRSIAISNDHDRYQDNSSVPPPENMELLNFEALDDDYSVLQRDDRTPLPLSVVLPSTNMNVSSFAMTNLDESTLSSESDEIPTPIIDPTQQHILAHNRLSVWFQLPAEIWFKILCSLSTKDLHSFSYVCKRFHTLAQDQACHHKIVVTRQMKLEQIWFDAIQRRKPLALSFIECRQQDQEKTDEQPDIK
jgi:hypothetical protein